MTMPNPVKMLCVCGLGVGSSLILRVTVEATVNRMGLNAEIDHTGPSSARSMKPGVVIGQGMHTDELEGVAPVIMSVDDSLDNAVAEERLRAAFTTAG